MGVPWTVSGALAQDKMGNSPLAPCLSRPDNGSHFLVLVCALCLFVYDASCYVVTSCEVLPGHCRVRYFLGLVH